MDQERNIFWCVLVFYDFLHANLDNALSLSHLKIRQKLHYLLSYDHTKSTTSASNQCHQKKFFLLGNDPILLFHRKPKKINVLWVAIEK